MISDDRQFVQDCGGSREETERNFDMIFDGIEMPDGSHVWCLSMNGSACCVSSQKFDTEEEARENSKLFVQKLAAIFGAQVVNPAEFN